jgi:hypothetical protein
MLQEQTLDVLLWLTPTTIAKDPLQFPDER